MTRPGLGRGRFLVVVGAIVMLIGMALPWWVFQPTNQPALSGNGFEGAGMIVFGAALLMLALIVLPFASRDGDSRLDRAPSYIVLTLVAIGAYLFRAYQIVQDNLLAPTQSIGLWVTGIGLAIVAWGVGSILTERARDY